MWIIPILFIKICKLLGLKNVDKVIYERGVMEEIWRDIPGYEGLYRVSNTGKVQSNFSGEWRELKQFHSSNGYLQVHLGKYNTTKVHSLVARAFIENPENLPQVNHIDENKDNNHVDNLEWCSARYNLNYGSRNIRSRESIKNYYRGLKDEKNQQKSNHNQNCA